MGFLVLSFATLVASISAGPLSGQSVDLGPNLEVVGELRLEETNEALVQDPRMISDPRGGWIYLDRQAQDVRLFSRDGKLLHTFGGPGEGPGEFSGLIGAVRLDDDRLIAMDLGGRISLWSAAGDSLISDFVSRISGPYGLALTDDATVVALARTQSTSTGAIVPALRTLRLDSRRIQELGFDVPLHPDYLRIARGVLNPPPRVFGGSVYIAVAPFDTLWGVSLTKPTKIRSIPIQSNALNSGLEPPGSVSTSAARMDWRMSTSFPGRFFRMPSGGWIMMTWGPRPERKTTRGIVRFDDDGRLLWELEDTLQLVAIDADSGDLILWDPDGLEPARFLIARETGR